jgi:LPXTG-motif cell wall-anchored protein
MRAEFTQLKDGRYYAKRISPIDSAVADREQTYAQTRDSDMVMARDISDCGFVSAAPPGTTVSVMERRGDVATSELAFAQNEPEPVPVAERLETLPQTASNQPLMLLLGLFALGSAGLVAGLRGLGIV